MSLNFNKVILSGRLTTAPELKTTPNGIYVTAFTLAVDRKTTANDSEKKTDFINLVAWRKTAEFITKYFNKGSVLCVLGNIQTRSWEAQDGGKRYTTEVVVDEAYFVENKATNAVATNENGNVDQLTEPRMEIFDTNEDLPF